MAAAIATHRRDRELARLLDSLAASDVPITGGIFVADNASSAETHEVCTRAPLPCTWIGRSVNNGPGPAWNTAVARALEDTAVTYVLVLDDDVVVPPDAVRLLLRAMGDGGSAAAAPLLSDERGQLWGFPEPREKALREAIRRARTPDECRALLGSGPHAFCWATGACMLYARRALETGRLFREDFWMLGEDLEFSMRVAATSGGVFTTDVTIAHLPPPAADPRMGRIAHRGKFLALLQNLSHLAWHSPHSGHLRCYLAGNFRRYARTEGRSPGTLTDALCAFWQGAVRGRPAGTPAGARLRERARRRMERDRPE